MREEVLQAVETLVRDRGWEGTRMADVATVAGVSRQTLYQLYGSREALAQAYVLRETDRFLSSVEAAIRARAEDPFAAIVAGLDAFLTGAADNVLVKAVCQGYDSEGLPPLFTTQGRPMLDTAQQRLTTAIHELWPVFRDEDVRLFAGSIVRLAISHVTLPTGSAEAAVEDIARLLTPFVAHALSPPPPPPPR
jgi:AcrR family transcriptional regulator